LIQIVYFTLKSLNIAYKCNALFLSSAFPNRLMGFAPTLKRIEWRGCALFTFGDGDLIHDIWALNDDSDLEEKLKTNKSLMHT